MMGLDCNREDLAYVLSLPISKDSKALEYAAWEGGEIPTMRSTQQTNVL